MKLGVLGGTFDPIHLGHLIIAEEARDALGLDRVLFVPAGQPWLKADTVIASGAHRLAMVQAAIAGNPAFGVSPLELDRRGPSYTADTLEELQEDYGAAAELYFIMGADALGDFGRWHHPERVLELCTLAVVGRPSQGALDLAAVAAVSPGAAERVAVVADVAVGISATDVRRRVAEGRSIRYRVPPAVERYIQQHGLYKEGR